MATGPPYLSSTSVVDSLPSDVSANAFIEKPLLREDQVQNAVEFMSHPRVRSSPAVCRRSFLQKKCLTKEEIDEAFRRLPDLPSNATNGETYTTEHAMPQVSLATLQHQGPIQTPQSTDIPFNVVSLFPTLQQPMFNWSQALLAAGMVAASGAGTALLFKKKIIPKFKVWIKKIVGEEIETKEDRLGYKLAKEAAEAAKAAAAAAAAVAEASKELIIIKIEERKYYDALMGTLDIQFKEIKSMGEAICRLENRIEDGFSVGSITSKLSSHVKQSDHINANGTSNTNFEEVCSPLPLALVESLFTPTRSSDTEQREAAHQVQQQSIYALQSQSNDQSSGSRTKESYGSSYAMTGTDNDAPEPWLSNKRTKISEVESQVEKKQLNWRLKQRGRLPPRPAAVVLPVAADAIQRPKLPLQQLSGDEQSVATSNYVEKKPSTLYYIAKAKNPGSMPFGTSQRKEKKAKCGSSYLS